MRIILTLLFLTFYNPGFSQSVKEQFPTSFIPVNVSVEGEREFLKQKEICQEVWNKVLKPKDYDNLSPEDKKTYDACDDGREDYWHVLDVGCSWYCGGGEDTATASSALESKNNLEYDASKSHDLSYKTAWVEGVSGYGIGEYIMYHFPPQNPRVTKVIIVNGYIKDPNTWKENSRVKKLKFYINEKPVSILNLEDERSAQVFEFEPIGNDARNNYDALILQPWWTMKFEILEVYKGDKYDDTAITEIYFDGIDVH